MLSYLYRFCGAVLLCSCFLFLKYHAVRPGLCESTDRKCTRGIREGEPLALNPWVCFNFQAVQVKSRQTPTIHGDYVSPPPSFAKLRSLVHLHMKGLAPRIVKSVNPLAHSRTQCVRTHKTIVVVVGLLHRAMAVVRWCRMLPSLASL
ncbi:hypothetical protein BV22DRAFT_309729 [Leucogyrophana mollusca]|uniref:Uncharacterized protein n=1 Tax=Leucogyrophana mollusca TaxID=85980 RepID=A0ACB8BMR3_9AGAM|nr:hypothetical protein BV22DRAFT_309729 [Leucogyrophana mollusca]